MLDRQDGHGWGTAGARLGDANLIGVGAATADKNIRDAQGCDSKDL